MRAATTYRAAVILAAFLLAACGEPNTRSANRSGAEELATDAAFLQSSLWDDGQAEVAFYEVRRSRNQYDEPEDQQFLVGAYLVKHDYDPETEAKAASNAQQRVESFKYALFYEFESGSYEYKRSYVTNARRSDLRPLKTSFVSFDWCSNQYREMAFHLDGTVEFLMRSDDYGNSRAEIEYSAGSVPPAQIPLLIRGLDFSATDRVDFRVLLENGETIAAAAQLEGTDSLAVGEDQVEAERIVVHYDRPAPSIVAEATDATETYWRASDEERTLVRLEGDSGRYEMALVEQLRSPYWEENVYERLDRVQTRP